MKKLLLSFILAVAAFTPTWADGYNGVLVNDGTQKTYYLLEEKPSVKYMNIDGETKACLYVKGETEPIGIFPVSGGDKLSVKYDEFVRVTLNNAGYATFSAGAESFIATEDITAYKAVVDGEVITLLALEGNIPKGTGVMLYGETPNTTVTLPVAKDVNPANVEGNSLLPTTRADGSLATFVENSWALGNGNQFLRYTGRAFIHNRAYLVHVHPTGAKEMRMVFAENDATGLDNAVSKTSARKGKFIENGNIVIIKNGMKYNVAGQAIK